MQKRVFILDMILEFYNEEWFQRWIHICSLGTFHKQVVLKNKLVDFRHFVVYIILFSQCGVC